MFDSKKRAVKYDGVYLKVFDGNIEESWKMIDELLAQGWSIRTSYQTNFSQSPHIMLEKIKSAN